MWIRSPIYIRVAASRCLFSNDAEEAIPRLDSSVAADVLFIEPFFPFGL